VTYIVITCVCDDDLSI